MTLDNVFDWLIEDLKKKKQLMPRHVLFCETIADVSKLYAFFVGQFGSNCDLIDMFHSKTNDKIKEKIRNDMAVDGKIRLLICANSAGMRVNFYGLHNIIQEKWIHLFNRWEDVVGMDSFRMNLFYIRHIHDT
jgi:hypothetical protein